jgi:hypothetical protein
MALTPCRQRKTGDATAELDELLGAGRQRVEGIGVISIGDSCAPKMIGALVAAEILGRALI